MNKVLTIRTRKIILGCICSLAVLGMLGAMCYFGLSASYKRAERTSCVANLCFISKACIFHAMDHDDEYPSSLAECFEHPSASKLLICRSSGNKPGGVSNVNEWTDYVYISGLKSSDPSGAVLAFCPPGNHTGRGADVLPNGTVVDRNGVNVLFNDGSVARVGLEEFDALTNTPHVFFGTYIVTSQ